MFDLLGRTGICDEIAEWNFLFILTQLTIKGRYSALFFRKNKGKFHVKEQRNNVVLKSTATCCCNGGKKG